MEIVQALEQLRKVIFAIHPLSTDEWNDFALIWKQFEAKRKTILTKTGKTERHLYFVVEGVQRGFYVHDDGREATIVFTYPFSFSGIADSFLTQQPSRFFLETLTASSFLCTEYAQVNAFNAALSKFSNVYVQSGELHFCRRAGKADRITVLFC